MLSNVRLLKVFLLMLALLMNLFSEAPQRIEIDSKISPEQVISRLSEEDRVNLTQFFREILLQSQAVMFSLA